MQKYDVSESVHHEAYGLGGEVEQLDVAAGQVELSDEELALLERVAPGVATPVKTSDQKQGK